MTQLKVGIRRLETIIHRYFLALVIAAYALAAVFPALGLWSKHCAVIESDGTKLVLPMILLATLLFNASLSASSGDSLLNRISIVG